VAALFKKGTNQLLASKHFRMKPQFDLTGIADFDGLQPNTEYSFRMGYLLTDQGLDEPPSLESLDWWQASEGQVRTAPSSTDNAVSFVFGSCRYNQRENPDFNIEMTSAGDPTLREPEGFRDTRADKIFRSILEQIQSGVRTDFLLMVGDQIYADDFNILSPARGLSEFFGRYADVFGQEHMRALMCRCPTYMILDDHEITDNWSQDRLNREQDRFLYYNAMRAYESYQLVHGPAFQRDPRSNRSESPTSLWYKYDVGRASFFVTDTRTERNRKSVPPRIVSGEQMNELKKWLSEKKKEVKFVVSSVPFFPDPKTEADDKWAGFSEQRREILDFIREGKIRPVVFLSGDIHLSAWATLECPSDPSFRVHSVISSPFYWPYWNDSKDNFVTSGIVEDSGQHKYRIAATGWWERGNNFVRVTLQNGGKNLLLEVYGRKGARLRKKELIL
jgi:alkaline phosphatase D